MLQNSEVSCKGQSWTLQYCKRIVVNRSKILLSFALKKGAGDRRVVTEKVNNKQY
jgi:hypothetical protein